ncbi:MAG: ATP synthase F0 subunit B [Chloroflexota bacterium]
MILEQSRPIPLSNFRAIDAEQFSQLLERMRINVPSAIRESERTLRERDVILADAHDQAHQIINDARQQALELLREDRMVVAARQESERILQESQAASLHRTQEADRYAMSVLQDLAYRLANVSSQVQNGVELLSDNMRDGTMSVDDVSYDAGYPAEYPTAESLDGNDLPEQAGTSGAGRHGEGTSHYTQPQQSTSETTYETY